MYVYKINLGEYNPILKDYVNQNVNNLDIKAMKKASKVFLGVHNFKNFVSGERDNYDCIIYKIKFKVVDNILEIEFTGKSFYRYMVRNLVGAMIEVGRGKIDIIDVKKVLDLQINKTLFTAPANGLYLEKVIY